MRNGCTAYCCRRLGVQGIEIETENGRMVEAFGPDRRAEVNGGEAAKVVDGTCSH